MHSTKDLLISWTPMVQAPPTSWGIAEVHEGIAAGEPHAWPATYQVWGVSDQFLKLLRTVRYAVQNSFRNYSETLKTL